MRNSQKVRDALACLQNVMFEHAKDVHKDVRDAFLDVVRAFAYQDAQDQAKREQERWINGHAHRFKSLGDQLIAANRDAAQKMKDETEQAYEIATRMMKEDEEDDA